MKWKMRQQLNMHIAHNIESDGLIHQTAALSNEGLAFSHLWLLSIQFFFSNLISSNARYIMKEPIQILSGYNGINTDF